MASQVPPGRKEGCLRVAVVGLSGQSRDGGGVGKSCLCNRFVRPAEDNYSEEHLSTVTSSDFYGPIINSQHFLYWGYTKKGSKSSSSSPELNAAVAAAASALGSKKSYEFEVIEHTLFVDDSTLTAFGTGEGSLAAYIRRVSKTKLSSPGKVAYLNRDHLEDVSVGGTKFKTDPFPTPFEVDAFVVAADVSRQRPDQTKWLEKVFSTIGKLKRPFIVAACKCDIGNPVCMEELETLVKRCAKGTAIVETSAKEGVNVENAFLALASAIRKNGKHVPFHGKVADSYPDASRAMAEERSTLMAQFKILLEREIHDFQITWSKVEQSLKNREELQLVLASAGRDAVRRVVMAHAKKLKEERRVEQLAVYKSLMLKAMEVLLPGVRNNTRFEDAVDVVTEHTVMSDYFVDLGWPWDSREGLANPPLNDKVPLELLRSVHGREVYENHVQIMQVARQEAEEGKTLRSLLESHRNELVPGKFDLLCISACLPVCLPTFPSVRLFVCVCLCVRLSVSISVSFYLPLVVGLWIIGMYGVIGPAPCTIQSLVEYSTPWPWAIAFFVLSLFGTMSHYMYSRFETCKGRNVRVHSSFCMVLIVKNLSSVPFCR